RLSCRSRLKFLGHIVGDKPSRDEPKHRSGQDYVVETAGVVAIYIDCLAGHVGAHRVDGACGKQMRVKPLPRSSALQPKRTCSGHESKIRENIHPVKSRAVNSF